MKVLIVAKTRQRNGACIGGLTFEGRSVKLLQGNLRMIVRTECVLPAHIAGIAFRLVIKHLENGFGAG